MLTAAEVRFTTGAGGLTLADSVYGSGSPAIVFVSPLMSHVEVMVEPPETSQIWERLAALGSLILFDRRGAGLSDPAPGMDGASLEAWCDDLEAVLTAAGAEQVCLFTFDSGTPYSLVFAASHPERVNSIALIEPLLPYAGAPGGPEYAAMFAELIGGGWGEGVVPRLLSPKLAGDVRSAEWWARFERMSMSRGTARQSIRDYTMIDVRSAVPLVRAPVLLMGRKSPGGPAADQQPAGAGSARWLHEHLPESELVLVDHGDVQWWWDLDLRSEMLDRTTAHFFHDAVVKRALDQQRGQFLKSTGDGAVATFDVPARALRGAGAIRDQLGAASLETRVGVHTGEIERRPDDIAGLAVHLAARIMGAARPGEILVSRTVRDLVVGSGLAFTDRGEHELKGISEPWHLFALETT